MKRHVLSYWMAEAIDETNLTIRCSSRNAVIQKQKNCGYETYYAIFITVYFDTVDELNDYIKDMRISEE